MKFFSLLLLMAAGELVAGSLALRVAVRSEHDVVSLYRSGFICDDVKFTELRGVDGMVRTRARYNSENGFVTVLTDEVGAAEIAQRGFTIISSLSVGERSPDLPTLLDTIPYQFGWPRSIFNGNSLYENSPTIADIDRNGQLEVSITNAWGSYEPPNPPYLITWRRNGAYLPGFPAALQPGIMQSSLDAGISAAADIFGDDKLEFVLGDENGYLYAFNHDGSSLAGFPVHYGYQHGVFTPALADVDGDGKAEIAVIHHAWNSPFDNAFLHLLKITPTGPVEMPGFPINIVRGASNSPAIGDIDGNGVMDIVYCTGGAPDSSTLAKIVAVDMTGQVLPGFPYVIGRNSIGNSPTLYDITGDGKLEILIRMKPDDNINGIYAINYQGSVVPGFPFPIPFGNPSACVAVGDVDGDGSPELAYGGVEAIDSGKVWVYKLAGSLLPGYPARVFRTWVDGSVAIADVDGDGKGDVVCGTNGISNKPGLIRAFNYLGREVQGFPLSPGNPILNSFQTHPTVVDIDGDGDTEIFAGRLDKLVYGWDTPGIFDANRVWRTFKGNAARTGGQVRSPFLVSVNEQSQQPKGFRLYQNYPNPFNPTTTITFDISEPNVVTLKVHDMLGREVATLVNEPMQPGRYKRELDAAGLASGVYLYRLEAGRAVSIRKLVVVR